MREGPPPATAAGRRRALVAGAIAATLVAVAALLLLFSARARPLRPPSPPPRVAFDSEVGSTAVIVVNEEIPERTTADEAPATAGSPDEGRDSTMGLRVGERLVRDPQAMAPEPEAERSAIPAPAETTLRPGPPTVETAGSVRRARLVEAPRPVYPPLARARKLEATVELRVRVGADGRVVEAELVGRPAGYGFDEAARQAALSAVYQPARLDGKPVESQAMLTIRFVLGRGAGR